MISYQVSNQIALIGLDNPPANAICEELLSQLIDCMDRASDDDDVRAVVLHSEQPKRFCSGLDLRLLHEADESDVRRLLQRLYMEVYEAQYRLGKPTIAAIEGAARGGGMTVAISCDVIVAAEQATFGYPEIDIGVLPAIHYSHLPEIVGRHRAFELLFSGRTFDAHEAYRIGLLGRVANAGCALRDALELAGTFAQKPRETLRVGRRAFIDALGKGSHRARIEHAVDTFCAIAGTADAQEGIRAFTEKRRPNWHA